MPGGMFHVDLVVVSGKAHGEPFLRLAAVFALPRLAHDFTRNVVFQPVSDLAEPFHRADIGLFAQFPHRRRPRLFAFIDAALRHLPRMREVDMFRPVDAPADEHQALAIEQNDANAGTIGEIFEAHWQI